MFTWLKEMFSGKKEYSPTVAFSKSKKCRDVKKQLSKISLSIPDNIWEKMPDDFKRYVKQAKKEGAVVSYIPPCKIPEGTPIFTPLQLGNSISVFYGPLMSRIFTIEGDCIGIS
jgi:hypothetical protein